MNQEEKKNHLRARLLDLLEGPEEGPEDEEAASYERTFSALGITVSERSQLRALAGNPGVDVLAKIYRLRTEALQSRLLYQAERLTRDEKLELLSLWQAMALALDDITNFPQMAERVANPIEPTEEGEQEYGIE